MEKNIFQSAEKMLAMRMHSVSELRTKLHRKFPDRKEEIEKVIDYFLDTKALDDFEFTKMYVAHRQLQKPKSEYVLKKELEQKGVDPEIITSALGESPVDDDQNAMTLAKRKLLGIPNIIEAQKKKERLFRYLGSQGFSYGVIQRTIDSLKSEF